MKKSIFMALAAAISLAGCGGDPDVTIGDEYTLYLYDNANVPDGCTFQGYITIDGDTMLQYKCSGTGAGHE